MKDFFMSAKRTLVACAVCFLLLSIAVYGCGFSKENRDQEKRMRKNVGDYGAVKGST